MDTGHKYYDLIAAFAEGRPIQKIGDNGWENSSPDTSFYYLSIDRAHLLRVKPSTVQIEIARPMTDAPQKGTDYYVLDPFSEDGIDSMTWNNSPFDKRALSNGMAWSNRKDALVLASAIKNLLKGGQ